MEPCGKSPAPARALHVSLGHGADRPAGLPEGHGFKSCPRNHLHRTLEQSAGSRIHLQLRIAPVRRPEAIAVVDAAAIDAAWAELAAVKQKHVEAEQSQREADDALTAARLNLDGLISRAAAPGKAVPPGEIEAA